MTTKKLTVKQNQFCIEYIIDLNATQAAIRAGYSAKTAESQGSTLLRNPKVAERVNILKTERSESTGITAERVLEEYAKIAFADPNEFFESIKLKDGRKIVMMKDNILDSKSIGAISTIEPGPYGPKVKTYDKTKALDSLAKHLGLLTQKIEVSGEVEAKLDLSNLSTEKLRALKEIWDKKE